MSKSSCYPQIFSLLNEELSVSNRLLDLLAQEQTAITSSDPTGLEVLVAEKGQCIERLEQLNRHRESLLHQHGYGEGRRAMDTFFKREDQDGQLEAIWTDLLSQIKQCRHANQVNGVVINTARNSMRDILRLISGQDRASTTYSASGATQSGAASRFLGDA